MGEGSGCKGLMMMVGGVVGVGVGGLEGVGMGVQWVGIKLLVGDRVLLGWGWLVGGA